MDIKQAQSTYQSALRLLLLGRLKQAFDHLGTLARELPDWTLHEQLSGLQQNYRYMLQYYIGGMEDPERPTMYSKLLAQLFSLAEEIKERLFEQNSTGFTYTRKRYFPGTRRFADSLRLLAALEECHTRRQALADDPARHQDELNRIENDYEGLLPEVFALFWLSTRLDNDDKTLFQRITQKDYDGLLEQSLAVSALTLNLWRMFDEGKLLLLFDCCDTGSVTVKQRALVGLCFILAKYDLFLGYFPRVRNRLVLLADNEHTQENFRNIIRQIIGTTETEKISKRLQEDILPAIAKLSPKLNRKTDVESLLKSDDWEETNPQWEAIFEDSDVSDKLKELTELQMEGADVYMSTFSMLKTFPFFNELSNWFLPFSPAHSAVHTLFADHDRNILQAFIGSRVMCDSDLYSFCLSVQQMPASQRDMLKQSFKAESEQMDEMQRDEALLAPDVTAKYISKQYIQDLFRFFKLHPQRKDFMDMFDFALALHKTHLFDILAVDSRFKADIAECYFAKKLYPQALELFDELAAEQKPTADLYQKMGYACQKTSQLDRALDAYLKADVIQPDDLWTVKKIALCYRLVGNHEKAVEYYRHADFLKPGELSTQMQIAHAYLQEGKNKEALNLYFKLDAEHEDNVKVQRAIAWASFITGNLKQADHYMQRVLNGAAPATAQDYLNAGHIAWSNKDRPTALSYYKKSLASQPGGWQAFQEALQQDFQHLQDNGISPDEFPLMLDEVQYE